MMKKSIYALLAAALFYSACFNPKKYDDITPMGLIAISSSDSTTAADGSGSYVVNAEVLDKKADAGKRTIVFKTTMGTFKGGSDSIAVVADANFQCSAKLTSVKAGKATVTAKIQNITALKTPSVTFTTAFPSKVTVAVDSFSVKNDNRSETLVTATLGTASGGVPSVGTTVTFTATDNLGTMVGTFLNNISTGNTDANGQVKLRYAPINTPYTGYLTFTATSTDADGKPVLGTTRIFITK
ncbi:hypothetical protein KXD93_22335 [Mucilaginibacter sp. BJC16-A38]|uniref:hypothetical protein n=1 Tax=Mucilaginibacter phenanthrenivorans TaxID=1234842 RepID=UPI002157B313|nr:hypothetical protein [Mucilaginibacter phenanthrenivorans]MCR8560409.1 hypothetical protein [Mucilaginibacter phenanthrenivorans]